MFNIFKRKHALLSIYTDGSCQNNGSPEAVAGYAWYCLETKEKGVGSGEYDGKETNNTAELLAIYHALKYAQGKTQYVRIFSDSQYAIMSASKWGLHPGKKNYQLIADIKQAMREFEIVEFEWVKGHNISQWNNYVDSLAYGYVLERAKGKKATIKLN